MATIEIKKSRGYAGNMSKKSYVAAIDGTSDRYGLDRRFLEADDIDWGDSEMYRKHKGTWTEIHHVDVGLYEVCEYGDARYVMVWARNGAEVKTRIDLDRAQAIAKLLDDGVDFEIARVSTKPAQQPQVAANV